MEMEMSSTHTNSRLLSEAIDNAKEAAGDTYNGLKRTVQDNMILSITLAVAVFALLILCCYLKRKYSTSAQVISKRDYKNLLKARGKRETQLTDRRGHDQHINVSRERELEKRGKYSLHAEQKRKRWGMKDEYALANSSMETNQTMRSHEEVEFVGKNGDVETGEQGFEVGVSPIKASAEECHYLENDNEAIFDTENDHADGETKRSFFGRKKKKRQNSVGSF